MPLPGNSTLTLQGQPRPGDPMHSKPKQAMIIRMSKETFEALDQNQSNLEFDFGSTPGMYIGETFYPVKALPENASHELYLRLPSAQKPMAPLKLYANVIGKFIVERQLSEKVQETVRDRTIEAEKQRTERKAIQLDTPPVLNYPSTKGKGRKEPVASRRPLAVPSSSHATSSSKVSPLPVSSAYAYTSSGDSNTRARLIHCLAVTPEEKCTAAQTIKLCVGADPTPQMKSELVSLLQAVAEPVPKAKSSTSANSVPLWRLKLEAWREVRPYEWPLLTSEERTQLARMARKAFGAMKIPLSDPIWEHAHYRDPSGRTVSGPSAPAAEKNGVVMSKNTKKTKTSEGMRKKVSDIAIPSKDESGSGKGKAREVRERDMDEGSGAGTPTSATRPAARRLPGSGFKAKHSATPPVVEQRANSPLPPPPKKAAPVEAREVKRERETPALSGSGKSAVPPVAQESRSGSVAAAAAKIRKQAKDGKVSGTHRAQEGRRDDRARERDYAMEETQRSKGHASPAPALPSFKRKKPPHDGNESEYSERDQPLSASASKKRKLNEPQPSPEKSRPRDLSLPKKPVVRDSSPLGPPRQKVKKEPSPLSSAFSPPPVARSSLPPRPPPIEKHQASSSSSSAKSSKPAPPPSRPTGKSRRRSPIYTSSEDESEGSIPMSRSRTAGAQAHSPSDEPAAAKRYKPATANIPRFKPRPLPPDSTGLRKYYRSCYDIYAELHKETQRRRLLLQRLLNRSNERERGAGVDRDQDGSEDDMDVDELLPEVLADLRAEYEAVESELKKVRRALERLVGSVDLSGETVDE